MKTLGHKTFTYPLSDLTGGSREKPFNSRKSKLSGYLKTDLSVAFLPVLLLNVSDAGGQSRLLPRQAPETPATHIATLRLSIGVAFKTFKNVVRLNAQFGCSFGCSYRTHATAA